MPNRPHPPELPSPQGPCEPPATPSRRAGWMPGPDGRWTRTDHLTAAHVHRIAESRRHLYTPAERELETILNKMHRGVLRGKFGHEFPFAVENRGWILDFYLYDFRVGIEVDGDYHDDPEQKRRDEEKTSDLTNAGMTILRIRNLEVSGNRQELETKILAAIKKGFERTRGRFVGSLQGTNYRPVSLRGRPLPAMEAVTEDEMRLLKKHFKFYQDLEKGLRKPDGDRQKHFVAMCNGTAMAETNHEKAYARHMRLRSGETAELLGIEPSPSS